MNNVLIIGANGRSARQVVAHVADKHDVSLTLFGRDLARLGNLVPVGATLQEGDARDGKSLDAAMAGQDIAVVALGGMDLDKTTDAVVRAAERNGVNRIVTINAGGIYNELPEPFNTWDFERAGNTRPVNLRAAEAVERSSLAYTILRPVWLTDNDDTAVELTRKGDAYRGTETSRASLGAFIADIVRDPASYVGENLGITQPDTDGDRPAAYR